MDINIIKMGICVSSRNFYAGASSLYEVARWEEDFAAMQLETNDVERLHQVFERIDKDDSRNIELIELISLLDIDRTAFSERIFSIFDENKTGSINFYQFVVTLWNYCTLSDDSLPMFAFDLYDTECTGILTVDQVMLMLKEIYGNVVETQLIKSVTAGLVAVEKAKIPLNLDNFRNFVKTHQTFLYPIFQIQNRMRYKILGTRFWEKATRKRLKFSNGKHISVGNFITFHQSGHTILSIGKTSRESDPAGIKEVDLLVGMMGSKAARHQAQVRKQQGLKQGAQRMRSNAATVINQVKEELQCGEVLESPPTGAWATTPTPEVSPVGKLLVNEEPATVLAFSPPKHVPARRLSTPWTESALTIGPPCAQQFDYSQQRYDSTQGFATKTKPNAGFVYPKYSSKGMLKVHPAGGGQQEGVSIQPCGGCGLETVIEVGSPVCRGSRRRRTIELPIENYQVVSRIVRAAAELGQQESDNPARRVPLSAGPVMLSIAPTAGARNTGIRGSQQSSLAGAAAYVINIDTARDTGNRGSQQSTLATATTTAQTATAGAARNTGIRGSQQSTLSTAAAAQTAVSGSHKKLRARRSSHDITLHAQQSHHLESNGFAGCYLNRDFKPVMVRDRNGYQPTFLGRQRRRSFA